MRSRLCYLSMGLWLITVGLLGWMFVKGWTTAGTDQRTAIILAPAERDLILGEMRMLLKAVHGVVTGLSHSDMDGKSMEEAARTAGMTMAADVNPAVMAKLPLAFKQMGMSIHRDMDALADAVVMRETPQQILQRLSSMTARCTTCHDMFQLVAKE
jgi:cytochrome c556